MNQAAKTLVRYRPETSVASTVPLLHSTYLQNQSYKMQPTLIWLFPIDYLRICIPLLTCFPFRQKSPKSCGLGLVDTSITTTCSVSSNSSFFAATVSVLEELVLRGENPTQIL